ncbi:MAG: Eco57I restriction-modification methylase domain-containing protein [Myxococcota bacterium]
MSNPESSLSWGRAELAESIQAGDWSRLARQLGFEGGHPVDIPPSTYDVWGIEAESAAQFDDLQMLASESGFRLLLLRGDAEYRVFRSLVTGLERRNAEDAALWWWDRGSTAMAAMATRGRDGRLRVRTIEISRGDPEPVALEAWAKLERDRAVTVDRTDSGVAMRRHLAAAFEHRELTRAFFREFSGALERLIETLEAGPAGEQDRHEICLAALLRMVFVYFLQRRGMLDDDPAFVLRHLRGARRGGRNFSESVLKPLFFGALNSAIGAREEPAAALGALPFLNGGLFEPLPIEESHPGFSWPNQVWTEIIEGLFERYHFAVTETQADDARSAVDPEMLGRVFEGLMYGTARHKSGSFYTPRDVVRSMVESALSAYLVDRGAVSPSIAEAVVRGDGGRVGGDEAREIREALSAVTILDPAVGTGAFLLESLHCLRRCWRAVGREEDVASMDEYRHVRSLIHGHLFGVDIQQTAVRLCELRLWLALLGSMPRLPNDEVPPLPNLAHRVCTGNSLISPLDIVQLKSGATKSNEQGWGLGDAGDITRRFRQRSRQLQDQWLTSHGAEKHQVRGELEATTRQMQVALLDARRDKLLAKLDPLEKLAGSHDLFGEDVDLDRGQRDELDSLRKQLDALEEARDDLRAGRASGLAFSYAARFAAVLERGGFDIVVTNPPWVRASRIDDSLKGVLKRRYASHSRTLWEGAEALGIRAPFGAQTDLAALFLERSLELLAPGGHLCALVPAKLFRSLHGAALRRLLMEHDLLRLEDHSDAARDMFDATVYPAVLHARKVASTQTPRRRRRPTQRSRRPRPAAARRKIAVSTWRGETRSSWTAPKTALPAIADAPGAPWVLVQQEVSEIIAQMRRGSRSMGAIEALQPKRGLFTGANRYFLTTESEAQDVLAADWAAWTRRIVRGRDCRAWKVDAAQRIFWGYDAHGEVETQVPEEFRTYFEEHRRQLETRADYRSDAPLWQVFRVKPGLTQPKVLWRDLSPKLEAAYAGPDAVPLNTVYFVAFESETRARVFEALLNSEPLRAVAYALGERARGGWRRHFSWVMRMLPIPERVERVLSGAADVESLLEPRELEVLEHGDADARQALADELGARWFDLDDGQLERLVRWRLGTDSDDELEVAA